MAFLVLFLVAAIFCALVSASQESAENAISSAKDAVKNCYYAVKQAESAGANVDALMVTLNDAAGLLSQAELAYASNDYDSAYTYATQSQNKLTGFISQATAQKETALQIGNQNYIFIIMSLVIAVGILCGGIAGWAALSRHERRHLHGSRTV